MDSTEQQSASNMGKKEDEEFANSDSIQKQPDTKPLALPSLAHPHIHLDKPYLLSHKDTRHLVPKDGTFEEALALTAKAKPLYTTDALLERGAQLLADSSRAGVTHLRGFCEVDTSVGLKCLEVALKLKASWRSNLYVQVAAFAQDPIFSTKDGGTGANAGDAPQDFISDGNRNLELLRTALQEEDVEVLATTPYVESSLAAAKRNIEWAIRTAIEHNLHLDFHLDYNVDGNKEPMVWHVLDQLHKQHWTRKQRGKTVCLGHCTRLILFSPQEWERLAKECAHLPVYFIGLPTSDLFMQGRTETYNLAVAMAAVSHNRRRSTLHVPSLLNLGLNAAIGVNNVGNSFTPFGSADPLRLAEWAVGIYQTGTHEDARTLYGCISWRAKEAMGFDDDEHVQSDQQDQIDWNTNDAADMIIFGPQDTTRKFVLHRTSMEEVVWNPPPEQDRLVFYQGKRVDV